MLKNNLIGLVFIIIGILLILNSNGKYSLQIMIAGGFLVLVATYFLKKGQAELMQKILKRATQNRKTRK